jgi:flagellar motor switch protein FliG
LYFEKIEKRPAATNSSAKLGKIIARLDKKAITRFLKIIHIDDLAKTVKDMDGKVQIKIFNHLPDRGASLLLETVEQMDSIEHHEIVEAQNKVVAIMSELKDQGHIT